MNRKGMLIIVVIGIIILGLYAYADETVQYGDGADSVTTVIRKMGDADADGEVTAKDARIILRNSVGLEKLDDTDILFSDIDTDGVVSASDARHALRISVCLETTVVRSFTLSDSTQESFLSDETESMQISDTEITHEFKENICTNCGYSEKTACYDKLVEYTVNNGSNNNGVYSVTDENGFGLFSLCYDTINESLYVYLKHSSISGNDILLLRCYLRIYEGFSDYEAEFLYSVNSEYRGSAVFHVDASSVAENTYQFLTLKNSDVAAEESEILTYIFQNAECAVYDSVTWLLLFVNHEDCENLSADIMGFTSLQ